MEKNKEYIINNSIFKNHYQLISKKNTSIREILKISDEDVRNRAYKIFLKRGGQPDSPVADWYKAEEELIRENIKKKESIISKVFVCQMN